MGADGNSSETAEGERNHSSCRLGLELGDCSRYEKVNPEEFSHSGAGGSVYISIGCKTLFRKDIVDTLPFKDSKITGIKEFSVVSMSATASPGAPAPLLSSNSRMAILGFPHAVPEAKRARRNKTQAKVRFLNIPNTPI